MTYRDRRELLRTIVDGPSQIRVNEHLVLMPFQVTIDSIQEREGELGLVTIVRDVTSFGAGDPKEVRFGVRLPWCGVPSQVDLLRGSRSDAAAEIVRRSEHIFQEIVGVLSHEVAECLRYTNGYNVREPHPELRRGRRAGG